MIYLACDHGGFALKEKLKAHLSSLNLEFEDVGSQTLDPNDDFVDFVKLATAKIGENDRGIFLCRNGVGVDIAANRFSHIRSVLGFNIVQVQKARSDDDCNVLALPADYIDEPTALQLTEAFLNTKYSGEERFIRRLDKLRKIND